MATPPISTISSASDIDRTPRGGADRRDRIAKERRRRAELIAEQQRRRQAWPAANYEPPSF
jgi:hypothetical protein